MEHVDKKRIHNNIYKYGIQDTEENFNKIGEVIQKRKFYIYRTILYIVDKCWIIEEDSTEITIEIDLDEHRNLLEDLTNSFFTKKISTRKVEKKNWTCLILRKSILDIENLQWFLGKDEFGTYRYIKIKKTIY